jgi:hypothetical protein
MRKVIFMLILSFVSSSAMAEWMAVGTSTTGEIFTIYVDYSTIRKAGNRVKMWELMDFKTAQRDASNGKFFMSLKEQSEYDCKDEQGRTLYESHHSGGMGTGEVIYGATNSDSNWVPVPPESIDKALWKIACGKK